MYRPEDYDIITKNISNVAKEAQILSKKILEPTIDEYNNAVKVILNYVKDKKLIIYGGYAHDMLIKMKKGDDGIFNENDVADIDVYSYNPICDGMDLCDILHDKGFKNVQCSNGVHEGTLKIFVNYENYCDFSYMPKNIFDRCPIILNNNLKLIHPYFSYIDAYRVITDPMTSNYRLEKTVMRLTKMYKYYPIKGVYKEMRMKKNKYIGDIKKKIIKNSGMIVIGSTALNYYISKVNGQKLNIQYIQVISVNYEQDKNIILKKLNEDYKNVTIKEYYPFFQFYDEHTEYYIGNVCVIKLYNTYYRCIVNKTIKKKKIKIGTSQLILLYMLVDYYYSYIQKNKEEQENYYNMILLLIDIKNKYLKTNKKTIFDDTPFREYIMECDGDTMSVIRQSLLSKTDKYNRGKLVSFRYNGGTKSKRPDFKFSNVSGNEKKLK